MSAELFLCMSQEETETPYQFKMTGVNVYSIEEAAYHCFHHWKHSCDEFTSPEFLDWVKNTLGLHFMASKIADIDRLKNMCDKLIAFLGLFDAFDEIQLALLKSRMTEWDRRLEWERLKEQADYLMKKGEPAKAVNTYKKALAMEENPQLLNNIAVALMSLSRFQEAETAFEQALEKSPQHLQILLNAAEASIYAQHFEKALCLLKTAEELDGDNPDTQYLYGALNFEAMNIRYSIDYFERAIAINPDEHYIFRLADVYVKLRQYDKAIETVNRATTKGKAHLMKLASLHVDANNVPAAIKCIERALLANNNDVELWTKLAAYHRLDYHVERAESAVMKALTLDKNNTQTLLELARIKKAMGKTKEYQSALHGILVGLKTRYRENTGV